MKYSFVFHAHIPKWSFAPNGPARHFACTCPIVGGEVEQPQRVMHTAMSRTIVILLSNADVHMHGL